MLAAGVQITSGTRILDFGCGCGRTARWLLREWGDAEFWGADVDHESIQWCVAHIEGGRFVTNEPIPPLPFSSDYFDVIYCLSVFTHLDEDLQDRWLQEHHRILKVNGVLILSVFGLETVGALKEAERTILANRGLVHMTSTKLKGIVPPWYHTTVHSRDYLVSKLGRLFRTVEYDRVPDSGQDFVRATK